MGKNKNIKCAPSKKFTDGSCFSYNALKKIASAYNNKKPQVSIDTTLPKEQLVNQITDVLKNKCDDQVCWLRDSIIKNINDEEILNNTFLPEGPKGKYEWLSTIDINDVLKQYHSKYSDFIFLGAVPYDFLELPILGLHHNDIFETYHEKNKTKLGLIINLDTHNLPGSHWVALYCDLNNHHIYFFDSVGKKPGKRIRKFINRIVKYIYAKKNPKKTLDINNVIKSIKNNKTENNQDIQKLNEIDIRYNYIQHQFADSECGVYSINFIVQLLDGFTFDDIITNITKDEEMNKKRGEIFVNV